MKIHNGKLENKEYIKAWGSGKALREFLYVDDATDAIIFILNNYKGRGIINLGTGKSIQTKEIVGHSGEIHFHINKVEGVLKRELDISNLIKLGWKPKINLKEGLKRTYDYYLSLTKK